MAPHVNVDKICNDQCQPKIEQHVKIILSADICLYRCVIKYIHVTVHCEYII